MLVSLRAPSTRSEADARAAGARLRPQDRLVLAPGGVVRRGVGGEELGVLEPRLRGGAEGERARVLGAGLFSPSGAGERAGASEAQRCVVRMSLEERRVAGGRLVRAARILGDEPRELAGRALVGGVRRDTPLELPDRLASVAAVPEQELQPLVAQRGVVRRRGEQPTVLVRGSSSVARSRPRSRARPAARGIVLRASPMRRYLTASFAR